VLLLIVNMAPPQEFASCVGRSSSFEIRRSFPKNHGKGILECTGTLCLKRFASV